MLLHHTVYELLVRYVDPNKNSCLDFAALFAHLGAGSKVFEYMERYYTACHKVDPAWSPVTWFLNNAKCHLTVPNGVIPDLEPGKSSLSNPSAASKTTNGARPVPVLAWVANQKLTENSFNIKFLEILVPPERRYGRLIMYHGTTLAGAELVLDGININAALDFPRDFGLTKSFYLGMHICSLCVCLIVTNYDNRR